MRQFKILIVCTVTIRNEMLIYLTVSKYAIDSLNLSFKIEKKFNFMEYFQGNCILSMINAGFRLTQLCIEKKN